MKVVVISHALIQEAAQARWRILAERYPVHVTLLVPQVWKSTWFIKEQEFRATPVSQDNFRVIPLATTSHRHWSKYFFLSLDAQLRSLQPDIIYVIHEERILIHQQILTYRNLWSPQAKIIFFTMNALGIPQFKWHQRWRWQRVREGVEAAICHYPGCMASLREAGFDKPVFMQTQVGVDDRVFRPDPQERELVRKDLGLENHFVIGYAGRLTEDKGVHDLLAALPLSNVNWSLVLIGNGEMREHIEETVATNQWEDRVRILGIIPMNDVAKYMRAMDCFVLGSRTKPYWIDTFPLVTVQAMACGVPTIGSDSGAIPWQLEDTGIIFPEGDVNSLHQSLLTLAKDTDLRIKLGEAGRKKTLANFSTESLTDHFYQIITQVKTGEYIKNLAFDCPYKAHFPLI